MSRRGNDVRFAYDVRDRDSLDRAITNLENTMSNEANVSSSNKDIVLSIARVCHEVNREYCMSQGDFSQPQWEEASNEIRHSAFIGVKMHLDNPQATPRDSHESWMAQKAKDGWVYGEVKDAEKKTHPCMVPYAELPAEQRAKDYIFRGIVRAIAHEMARPA